MSAQCHLSLPRLLPIFVDWFDQLAGLGQTARGRPGPDIPSVYLLFDRDGKVTYVGQSGNVRARWARHESAGRFTFQEWDKGAWFIPGLPEEADRLALEACLIILLRPPRNRGVNLGIARDRVWAVRYRKGQGAAQE